MANKMDVPFGRVAGIDAKGNAIAEAGEDVSRDLVTIY